MVCSSITYLLITVQDSRHLAVAEKDLAAHKTMWLVAGDLLKPLEQRIVNLTRTKLFNQLAIVDCLELAVLANLTRDGPRVDILTLGLRRGSRVFGGHSRGLSC